MTSEHRPDPIDPDGSASPGPSGEGLGSEDLGRDDALHPDNLDDRPSRSRSPEDATINPDDDGYDSEEIAEDAVEYFTEEGDDDSPTSDSDAPAPG